MPRAGTITMPGGKPADYYEISMRQFDQQILPASMPATTVWGYGAVASASKRGLLLHNAPSLTIESQWKRPVRIKWINDLKDANGNYLPHLLPSGPTLHWANPPGGVAEPGLAARLRLNPGPYTGPVPIVTHLHGAVGVGDESDGYAEAWYLPAAANIPAGYATEGTWYDFFAGKAASKFGVTWGPGFATFQYPNDQRESTLWYHDHALGMTRLNVYAGPAGFFLVRGGHQGDKAILDTRTGTTAVLPSPARSEGDGSRPTRPTSRSRLPSGPTRSTTTGPCSTRTRGRSSTGLRGRTFPRHLVMRLKFAGPIMVNGFPAWLENRRRRLAPFLANGCQSRFLILELPQIPGVEGRRISNEAASWRSRPGTATAARLRWDLAAGRT